jgi:hypothetical protein
MEMVSEDGFLPSPHPDSRFQAYVSDSTNALADVVHIIGEDRYGVGRLFHCFLLQFMEDLSDREKERYLEGNLAA